MSVLLKLNDVYYAYDQGGPVLESFSLEVEKGEIVSLLGPSGCGKTTALRVISGFEDVHGGEVIIDGEIVSKSGSRKPPEHRGVGMVFQGGALFPHLTISANIGFGLHDRDDKEKRIEELLALIGLEGYGARYPHELSGGQQQRAALARAMAPRPSLILLDEPFSNLDADLREKLGHDLRVLLKKSGSTALLVTHDQREAFVMADRIALMNRGQIVQIGSAQDLYHHPKDPFAARFIGEGSFIHGVIRQDRAETALGSILLESEGLKEGAAVEILIRPEHLGSREDGASAQISGVVFRGSYTLTHLTLEDGTELKAMMSAEDEQLKVGLVNPNLRLRAWPLNRE